MNFWWSCPNFPTPYPKSSPTTSANWFGFFRGVVESPRGESFANGWNGAGIWTFWGELSWNVGLGMSFWTWLLLTKLTSWRAGGKCSFWFWFSFLSLIIPDQSLFRDILFSQTLTFSLWNVCSNYTLFYGYFCSICKLPHLFFFCFTLNLAFSISRKICFKCCCFSPS